MSGDILLRLGRWTLAALVPALVTACEPNWNGRTPVGRAPIPAQAARPASITTYSGDTVYSIARRYNLSVRELIEANGLQPPYLLNAGTVLRIPGGGGDYVVQKGDTLLGLARRLHVDFNSLAATNNKKPPYTLHPGETLTLPGSRPQAVASASSGNGSIVIASPNAGPPPKGQPRPAAAAIPASPIPPSPIPQPEAAPPPPASNAAFAPTQTLPPQPPPRAAGGFLWPVKGDVVAEFGPLPNKGQHNDGINIAAAKGTAVRAAENGVVAYSGNELKGFGNLLLIKHSDNWMTAYAHNDQLMVRKGDQVKRGQTISTVGSTGSVTSPQLHFEIRRGTEAVNPLDFLRDAIVAATSGG
jgi:murein DD-endopeptidase MepM/ murein hydrolase activator NlpD